MPYGLCPGPDQDHDVRLTGQQPADRVDAGATEIIQLTGGSGGQFGDDDRGMRADRGGDQWHATTVAGSEPYTRWPDDPGAV
ncbi:hypothetical protein GCM10027615_34360 [Plantactinospora veratri]